MSVYGERLAKVSPRQIKMLLVGGIVCANFVVMGLAGLSLHHNKRQHEARAEVQTQNLVQAIGQSVSSSVEKIDLALRAVVDELERQLASGAIDERAMNAVFARYMQRLPEIEAVRVADAKGLVFLGKGVDKAARTSWADREYFVYLRDHPGSGLQISKPRVGRVAKQYIVGFARRYNHPDGSFAGVVSAPVALDHFAGLLANFNAGPRGTLVMRDPDLGLIARQPPIPDKPVGTVGNREVSRELRARVEAGLPAGTYYTDLSADGTQRIVSFRMLPEARMLVAVGMERADYLADWKIEAANTGVLVFSFLLLSLLSAGFLLKLLNRMLRESARNERYLQCASDGIHVLDAQGQVVEANDRFCAMLGYGHDELVGMRVDNFDADAIERPPLALIDELLTRGVPLTFERRHLTRDGELIDVEINAAPFTLEDKQFIYASARDIRERKQAQAALLEAKRAAEAANLAKSQFLATMSHEIRTPLNGVLGMAQLLQLPELGEQERQEYARTIMSSGETLLALLNDILDLSKIDAGKMELIPAVFAPRQLVDEIAALFAETAHRKGLELEAAWHGPADARYWGDPIRLRQMLANLIGNAIKFTDRGGVRVAARETADGLLEFAVADTGIGIAAAQRDRLFKPFTQLDGSATRRHGGTGLGLSIVFSLARLMDGDVEVDSVPGEGSTFRLRVRLQRAQDGMVAVGRTVAQTGTPVSVAPVGRRCRILVAEDNRTNRQVIEAILDKCGQEHRSVENGEAAVAAVTAGEWRPDLVLMDCQMPGMDGFEATARIRSWEAEHGQPRLPIVALTASVYPEDRDQCLSAGMDDFLAKPVNMARLREVLDKWLERDAGQA